MKLLSFGGYYSRKRATEQEPCVLCYPKFKALQILPDAPDSAIETMIPSYPEQLFIHC
jgi:hypothetical protein